MGLLLEQYGSEMGIKHKKRVMEALEAIKNFLSIVGRSNLFLWKAYDLSNPTSTYSWYYNPLPKRTEMAIFEISYSKPGQAGLKQICIAPISEAVKNLVGL